MARRELAPAKAEVHNKERGKSKGDHADSREGISEVAPITGPKVQHAAGDEGKGDAVGAGHPLAVLDDLAVARGDEGGGGADDPGSSLHTGPGETRTAAGEGDPGCGADKDSDEVDTAENAMDLEMALAKS
jgi:hypothetical protein